MKFNLADLFESVVAVCKDKVAVVCGDRRLTFAELDCRANRLAHFLKKSVPGIFAVTIRDGGRIPMTRGALSFRNSTGLCTPGCPWGEGKRH